MLDLLTKRLLEAPPFREVRRSAERISLGYDAP
jgi:hypothetical protein